MKDTIKMLVLTERGNGIPEAIEKLMGDPYVLKKAKELLEKYNYDSDYKFELYNKAEMNRVIRLASRSIIAEMITQTAKGINDLGGQAYQDYLRDYPDKIVRVYPPVQYENFKVTHYAGYNRYYARNDTNVIEFLIVEFYKYADWTLTEDVYGSENIQITKLRCTSRQSEIEDGLIQSDSYKFSTRLSNEI